MIVAHDRREFEAGLALLRKRGGRIGFIPTMGYLHAGHAALIERAAADEMAPVVSVFVNPLQFGPMEDYGQYPRDEDRDLAISEQAGAALVYVPPAWDLLPEQPQVVIRVPAMQSTLCAPARPGHFEGVMAIVLRLFGLVRPEVAYFGEKDAQQLAILRRLVDDLNYPVRIVGVPIVREPSGLALSSRNRYLNDEDREAALHLYRALCAARAELASGERGGDRIVAVLTEALARDGRVRPEYAQMVDADTLAPSAKALGRTLLAVAAKVGRARLIDNFRLWVPVSGAPSTLLDDPPGKDGEIERVRRSAIRDTFRQVLGHRMVAWQAICLRSLRGADFQDLKTVKALMGKSVGEASSGPEQPSEAELSSLVDQVAHAVRAAQVV